MYGVGTKMWNGYGMEAKVMNETLSEDFSALSEENKKCVIEMTRFLVLTQNTIVPKMLNPENDLLHGETEERV